MLLSFNKYYLLVFLISLCLTCEVITGCTFVQPAAPPSEQVRFRVANLTLENRTVLDSRLNFKIIFTNQSDRETVVLKSRYDIDLAGTFIGTIKDEDKFTIPGRGQALRQAVLRVSNPAALEAIKQEIALDQHALDFDIRSRLMLSKPLGESFELRERVTLSFSRFLLKDGLRVRSYK